MNDYLLYDKTDKYDIERYAQGMLGMTFREICMAKGKDADFLWSDARNKGGMGLLIEKEFFDYEPNNSPEPDFREAGVELKSSPYETMSNGRKRAKERLSLTQINYTEVANDDVFEDSHLWRKCEWILLVYYEQLRGMDKLDCPIRYVRLWTPPEQDLVQIKEDYQKIIEKIKDGRAHELSEADTMYLGAATKGRTAADVRPQPYSDIPAKKRGFAYKQSYMTYVLNTYILGKRPMYESVMGDKLVGDIEGYILEKINARAGQDVNDICAEYGIDYEHPPKNLYAMLTYRMLGIKGNQAEEFIKANIVAKTIRLEPNGTIREHMSFPQFKFCNLVGQDFEDSDFYTILSERKFLFVVYQKTGDGGMYLKKALFWNMPVSDIEEKVRPVWEQTRYTIEHIKDIAVLHNGEHYMSIFPGHTYNYVCHVRPHGKDSSDTDVLPDGRLYPKQCFWLDRQYINKIISEDCIPH